MESSSWEEHARHVDRFLWHFAELAIVLMVGMFVLNITNMAYSFPNGYTYATGTNAISYSFAMLMTVLVIMIVWMRYRHHASRHIGEMSLAISVPVLLLDLLSSIGFLSGPSLLVGANVLVWLGMFGAMLYRWKIYSQPIHPNSHARRPLPMTSPSHLSKSGIVAFASLHRSDDD